MNYKQCQLIKNNSICVTWLPEKFAKSGKIIKLKNEDGWKVQAVWGIDSEENVKARERQYERWAVGKGLKK